MLLQTREQMILLRRQDRQISKIRRLKKNLFHFQKKIFKKIQENASNEDLKATLAELRFLKTQRFREMKPIDEGNAQLAKEEERLRAMDAHIAELERGNEIGMARIEEFKSKFFAESARRSHLKTQFVQAGEEFKKINQVFFYHFFIFVKTIYRKKLSQKNLKLIICESNIIFNLKWPRLRSLRMS